MQDLVASLFSSYEINAGAISLRFYLEHQVLLGLDLAIPCGLIVHELVSNSLKYGFPNGRSGEISVGITEDLDQKFTIFVSDNGVGLPPNFNFQNTASLGWQLVEALTQQISGHIKINSHTGVEFQITFPLV
ncbi:sensor histidine kinase [Nostoc sp. FACHB-190]|uniref:sensor histidine kinase n=1 Tax=Nostoc sp. FACHB-190 TaxID=2692838 RepID=UPI0037C6CA57